MDTTSQTGIDHVHSISLELLAASHDFLALAKNFTTSFSHPPVADWTAENQVNHVAAIKAEVVTRYERFDKAMRAFRRSIDDPAWGATVRVGRPVRINNIPEISGHLWPSQVAIRIAGAIRPIVEDLDTAGVVEHWESIRDALQPIELPDVSRAETETTSEYQKIKQPQLSESKNEDSQTTWREKKPVLKEPSVKEIQLFRLVVVAGMTQGRAAETISRETGKRTNQPQVSRAVRNVRDWLKAGNILPDIPTGRGAVKTTIRDPHELDKGPPTRGRVTRKSRSDY